MKDEKTKKLPWLLRIAEWKLKLLDFFSPVSLIIVRLYVALIFWKSGLTKIVDFDNTILLFKDEYMTHAKITFFGNQFLTPEIAAIGGTFAELAFPLLLIAGFASRFAAFGLLMMTAIIQFTYTSHPDHLIWAIMLIVILLQGAGRASWDFFIRGGVYGGLENVSVKEKLFAIMSTLCLSIFAAYLVFVNIIQMK